MSAAGPAYIWEIMERIPLSLNSERDGNGDRQGGGGNRGQAQPEKKPVMGWAAVAFGFLGVFFSFVFVPIGLICSILALFMGQAIWGFFGLMIGAAGILTSPILLGLIGLGAFAFVVDWQSLIQPLLDLFRGGGSGSAGGQGGLNV